MQYLHTLISKLRVKIILSFIRLAVRFNIECIVDTTIALYRIKNCNILQEEHDDLHKIKECDLGHTSPITYKNITCETINFEIVIFIK